MTRPLAAGELHFEVLGEDQRRVFPQLARWAQSHGFYLAGGTALALRFGHRESLDFDWFRRETFDPLELSREAGGDVSLEEIGGARGTLHARFDGVRVTFLSFDYPQLDELIVIDEPELAMADLDDLAAMKLAALLQRGERKDFYDLDLLLLDHRPLGDLLHLFDRKFGFDGTASLLRALTYFDDAQATPDPKLLDDRLSWERTRERLADAVRRYAGAAS